MLSWAWGAVGDAVGRSGRCGGSVWDSDAWGAVGDAVGDNGEPRVPCGFLRHRRTAPRPHRAAGWENVGARGAGREECGRGRPGAWAARGLNDAAASNRAHPPACVSQRRVTGRAFSPGRRIREQPERTTVLRCRCGGQREVTAPVGRCSDREKLGWSLFRRCRSGWSPLSHPIPGNPGVACGLSDQPLLRGRNSVQPRA